MQYLEVLLQDNDNDYTKVDGEAVAIALLEEKAEKITQRIHMATKSIVKMLQDHAVTAVEQGITLEIAINNTPNLGNKSKALLKGMMSKIAKKGWTKESIAEGKLIKGKDSGKVVGTPAGDSASGLFQLLDIVRDLISLAKEGKE